MDAEQLVQDVSGRLREALAGAERQAKEIVAEAEERARGLIADAEAEAERIRERADADAEARLAKVREALSGLEGTFGGGSRAETASEIDPRPAPDPHPQPQPVPEPAPPSEPEPQPPAEPEPLPPEPEIVPPAPPQPGRQPPSSTPAAVNGSESGRSSDKTAARIVATKMALDGSSREEIAAHLGDHYELEHAADLLDDVLARAKR